MLFRPLNDQSVFFESNIADDPVGAVKRHWIADATFDIEDHQWIVCLLTLTGIAAYRSRHWSSRCENKQPIIVSPESRTKQISLAPKATDMGCVFVIQSSAWLTLMVVPLRYWKPLIA